MKNIRKVLLIGILCVLGFSLFAQLQTPPVGPRLIPSGGTPSQTSLTAFIPPSNTVLSYMPSGYDAGYTSDANLPWKCFQQFSGATRSFDMVTIWAVIAGNSAAPRELKVEVYQGGTAPPTHLVNTTTATITPVLTGESLGGSYTIYSYTINIPVTNLVSGWISVQATNSGAGTFYWLNTNTAPASSCYQINNPTPWVKSLSLALGSSSAVPVSSWVIILGFMLIAGTVTFRFWRRLF